MTTQQIAHRHYLSVGMTNDQLALESLRYRALRRMSGEQYLALVRSVIAEHKSTHDFESAFDELVDKAVLAHANSEARA